MPLALFAAMALFIAADASAQGTVPESALQGPSYSLARPAMRPHRPGDDVAGAYLSALQKILPLHGYPAGPVTGTLDPATRRAILAYQRDQGLPEDAHDNGVLKATLDRITFGHAALPPRPSAPPTAPATAEAATPSSPEPAAAPAAPETIRGVQEKLKAQGYDIDATGTLDPPTANAIKAFQMSKGLPRSGAIDDKLLDALGP